MLHVQQIYTEWTDCPEGIAHEAKRLSIPESYRVPYFPPESKSILHRTRHRQQEEFLCTEFVNPMEGAGPHRIGSVLMSPQPGILLIDFIWSDDVTWQPQRESRRGFRLREKQWGRVRYNGWQSDPQRDDGRRFHMMVLNILFDKTLTPKRFVDTAPEFVLDEVVDFND